MKTIMNRIISAFTSLVVLTVIVIPAISFAETSEDFTECVIPIISNKSESTEWSGLKKDSKLFVSLEDACVLTGSEIAEISENDFVVQRNTVKLYGNINNKACLCVSETDYRMFNWNGEQLNPLSIGSWMPDASLIQPFALNIIKNEKGVFVELFPFVYAFGAEINKIDMATIDDMPEETKTVFSCLNFELYDGYYTIKSEVPFDKVYLEYISHPEYQFSWGKSFSEKISNVSRSLFARYYDVIINDYEFTTQLIGKYDSEEIYSDTLLRILNNRPGNFSVEDNYFENISENYDSFGSFSDNIISVADMSINSSALEFASPIAKLAISETKTIVNYSNYCYQLSRFNQAEVNLLQKGILDVKNDSLYEYDTATDDIKLIRTVFPAIAKVQQFEENYASLIDSTEKLNNDIQNVYNSLPGLLSEIYENIFNSTIEWGTGEILGTFAPEAKIALDIIDISIKQMHSDSAEYLSEALHAKYIAGITKNNIGLNNTEVCYYSLMLNLQANYTAYQLVEEFLHEYYSNSQDSNIGYNIEDDLMWKLVGQDKSLKPNMESILTTAYCSDRTFYGDMNSDWESLIASTLNGSSSSVIPDYSVEVANFSADAIVEQNFIWHIEPTIEAEDIINSDEDVHNFGDRRNYHYPSDEYSVIKQNGKYGIIRYDGTYFVEAKYEYGGIGYSEIDDLYVYDSNGSNNSFDYDFVYLQEDISKIDSNKKPASHGYTISSYIYCSIDNEIYDVTYEPQLLRELQKDNTSLFIVKQFDYDIKTEIKRYNTMCMESVPFRYGISNISELIIPCQYDYGCCNDSGDIYALEFNGKWGFFDLEGNQIIDFICEPMSNAINEYDWYPYFYNNSNCPYLATEGYIPVKISGECGYYDDKGNEVIPVGTFEEVRPVHNGLAWVKFGGKWGVIQMIAAEPDTNNKSEISIDEGEYGNLLYQVKDCEIIITGCNEGVTSLEIPSKIYKYPVTAINDSAFYNCNNVVSVTIPDTITRIGKFAFNGTAWLENRKAENPVVVENGFLLCYGEHIKGDVIIPLGVKCIADGVFAHSGITSCTIPNGVIYIGDDAFRHCKNLNNVVLPNGLISIGKEAFSGCLELTSIEIPESVMNFGTRCFVGYFVGETTPWFEKKLEENPLVIVNNIIIDGRTCKGDVVIPNTVIKIADGAFENCSLNSINIPDSVESIGNGAFSNCEKLSSVTIPKSVKDIGKAFCNCSSLSEITFLNPKCEIPISCFTIYNKIEEENYNINYYYDGVIKGFENSTAQKYAEKYGYKFNALAN